MNKDNRIATSKAVPGKVIHFPARQDFPAKWIRCRRGLDFSIGSFPWTLGVSLALLLSGWVAGTAKAQGSLTNGWTHTGMIAPVGDSDTWTFSAAAGDNLIIRVGEITQTNNFTPRIRLFNPDAAQQGLASASSAAEIAVTATNTGTFTVIVDDANGTVATGTYRLTLLRAGNPTVTAPGDEGELMTNGAAYTGYLPVGDLDAWTFTATNGNAIVVKVGQITDTNTFDPWVRLYGPDGVLLGSSFDSAAAEVTTRATNSGTFLVVIANNSYNNNAGDGTYLLTLAKTGDPVVVSPGDDGGPMTNGAAYQGSLPIGDLDLWTFTASNGDAIVVKLGQISETNVLDPWLRLYGPDGVLLESSFAYNSVEVTSRATNSGTFLVVVGNNPYNTDAGSGTYSLTMAKTGDPVVVSPGDEGGPMTNGVAHQGSLPIGDLDAWYFTAHAGDAIDLKVGQISETNVFDPWVRLYGPDGVLLDSKFAYTAAETEIRATNSGTFLVVIGNNPYNTDAGNGTYLLTLAKTGHPIVVSPGDEGGSMTNGAAHQGNLPPGDLDLWSFTANAGDAIVVRMGQVSETNLFDPWIRVYGPDGVRVGSSFSSYSTEVAIRATNSGTFLVVVGNNPYNTDAGSGAYLLTLAKTGDPIVVSPGRSGGSLTGADVYDGNLPIGGVDLWSFTICAGEPVDVRADEITQTNLFDPWVRVYGPNGALIGTSFGATFGEVALTTTNSGTFLVLISNNPYNSDAGYGSYQLTVNGLSYGLKLCDPIVSGANVALSAVGGTTNAPFIVFTETNISTPLPLWTPFLTNQFDLFGVFSHTNTFISGEPKRFFIIQEQ